MKRFQTFALLFAFALGIVTEWLCFPILDWDNQSNIFLWIKSIDYPEAFCLWFHSWPERLLGDLANPSPNFENLSYSPTFYAVAALQWALLYYFLFLVFCFFFRQTNPRILKIALTTAIVLLVVTLHYKLHSDFSDIPRMRNDIAIVAENVGRLRAETDFSAGMLRKFVGSGSNLVDRYIGTNSGAFEMWAPRFVPAPCDISESAFGREMNGYNQTMQKKYRDSLRQTNTPSLHPSPQ